MLNKKLNVLLVEDNVINQKVAMVFMRKMNCNVKLAVNGKIAVDMYAQAHEDIDLIFMDVMMPVMDGFTSTIEIRKFEKAHNLVPKKIIAMTAKALPDDLKKCLKIGMNNYLVKPVHFKDLKDVIEESAKHL